MALTTIIINRLRKAGKTKDPNLLTEQCWRLIRWDKMIISLLLTIPLNKFQQIPHSFQWSSEVFMRKLSLYRFYTSPYTPPPIPLFSSPIIPLIVMVMASIVRDQNGQLNWWKRDHQEGREEGVCIYQTSRIFIHWRLKEYITALEDTWRRLSVGLLLSCSQSRTCTLKHAQEYFCIREEGLVSVVTLISVLLHLPV